MASPPEVTERLASSIANAIGRSIQDDRVGRFRQVRRAKFIKSLEELIGFDNRICAKNHPRHNPLTCRGLKPLNPHNLSKAKDGPAGLRGKRRPAEELNDNRGGVKGFQTIVFPWTVELRALVGKHNSIMDQKRKHNSIMDQKRLP